MIKYRAMKNKKIDELFPKLKEELEKDEDLLFAYLFGAYGESRAGPLSDVDIGVFINKKTNYFEKKMELIEKATKILDTDEVDLIVLNEAPLSLAFQVIKTKRLLFSKDEERRIEFETKIIDLYCDFEPLRKITTSFLLRRIKEGKYGYK
jgi:predicted nucleotidyltransferase